MKKFLFLILIPFLTLGLTGCDDNQVKIEVARYRVVDIPPSLYTGCPTVGKLPHYSTLTDEEVAKIVVKLYRNDIKCRQSIIAIHQFMIDAHNTIDGQVVGNEGNAKY